jgi:hypothetical protein
MGLKGIPHPADDRSIGSHGFIPSGVSVLTMGFLSLDSARSLGGTDPVASICQPWLHTVVSLGCYELRTDATVIFRYAYVSSVSLRCYSSMTSEISIQG